MKYQVVGKNIKVTDGILSAVENKIGRMDKFFSNDVTCRVVVSTNGNTAKIEATIPLEQGTLRAEVGHEDLYAAIDLAVDKLEGQMRKLKTRMDRSNGRISLGRNMELDGLIADEKEDEEDVIVRQKSYYLTPMTIEEAIARMDALGHDFFIYLDKEDDQISVVYVRKNGGYGVIQAENPIK